jgi:hypothetical protein
MLHGVDGRELWNLAHMYQVQGISDWLINYCINSKNVGAVAQFACECVDQVSGQLLAACQTKAFECLPELREQELQGIGPCAAMELLSAYMNYANANPGRAHEVIEGFKFVSCWARANSGVRHVVSQAADMLDTLQLTKLPVDLLLQQVVPAGLLSGKQTCMIMKHMQQVDEDKELPPKVVRLHMVDRVPTYFDQQPEKFEEISAIAVGSKRGQQERLAIVYPTQGLVRVFSLPNMVASHEFGSDVFVCPSGVAFLPQGGMVCCDSELERTYEYNQDGEFVDSLPIRKGYMYSDFWGISVTPAGDVVVCNKDLHAVHVVGKGQSRCKVIMRNHDEDLLEHQYPDLEEADEDVHIEIHDPVASAVLLDGKIAVAERDNVVILDPNPTDRTSHRLEELRTPDGESLRATSIFVGYEGELVVRERHRILQFDCNRRLSWICETPDMPFGHVCKDFHGRLILSYAERGEVHVFRMEEAGIWAPQENRMKIDYLL